MAYLADDDGLACGEWSSTRPASRASARELNLEDAAGWLKRDQGR
jgi:hypothetical protein